MRQANSESLFSTDKEHKEFYWKKSHLEPKCFLINLPILLTTLCIICIRKVL